LRARVYDELPPHVRSTRAFWSWLLAEKLTCQDKSEAIARDVPAASNIGEVTRYGLAHSGLPPPWQAAQIAMRMLAKKFKLRLSFN